jgi:integrase
MDRLYLTIQKICGHANIETTAIYKGFGRKAPGGGERAAGD